MNKIYTTRARNYELWRETLTGTDHKFDKEISFLKDIFSSKSINSVIDLGGGIGLHAESLCKLGYYVTLFDRSSHALTVAKSREPKLTVRQGRFENINVTKKYDVSVSLWTTFTHIIGEKGLQHFFSWMRTKTNKLIILDQGNFYKYPSKFVKTYFSHQKNKKIVILREWTMTKSFRRKTTFTTTIHYRNKIDTFVDKEVMQFIPVDRLKQLLGNEWKLTHLLGDYSTNAHFDLNKSPRIITIFERKVHD